MVSDGWRLQPTVFIFASCADKCVFTGVANIGNRIRKNTEITVIRFLFEAFNHGSFCCFRCISRIQIRACLYKQKCYS